MRGIILIDNDNENIIEDDMIMIVEEKMTTIVDSSNLNDAFSKKINI